MSRAANDDQVAFWNGEVGQRWVRNQAMLDRAFAPLTAALLRHAAPRPGERVADIGCGCGEVTLECSRRVQPGGHVLGLDVSGPMLAQARRAAEGGPSPEWVEADAASYAFPGGGFDLLVSRFGVMFFADPVAAFANLRRALRPGGRLAMLCWQPLDANDWAAVPRAAVLRAVPPPEPTPPNAPGPFAFADAARVQAILAAAGFAKIKAEAVSVELVLGQGPGCLEEAVRFALEVGPSSALLREAEPDARERARTEVTAELRPRERAGVVALGARCWLYQAVQGSTLTIHA